MASVRMLDADIEFKMMQYLSFLRILTNDNKIIIDHYSVRTLVHASFLNPKYLRSQCKFIVMEFSIEISSSLRMLGDDSKIDEESFKAILSETIQDLMGNKDLPSTTVGQGGTNTGCGGGPRNCCHAALTTLLIEYIKGSHSNNVFSSALEDLNWPTDRVKKTVESLDMCRPVIRSKLASTGTYPPHVIDVDWKLNYRVRSSTGEEGGGAMYLITLHTEEADGQQGKVTFSCSLSQLTHLVTSLRQASRCIQKYASNS